MFILQGFVQNVIIKNEDVQGKNPYAVIGISDLSKDRDGFDVTILRKIMVAGNDFKKGLHNAYRTHIGSEVYAPVTVQCELFNGKPQERYTLIAPPVRLQEARPVQAAQPAQKAVGV